MLSFTNEQFLLSVFMLNGNMLSVFMLNGIMLSVVILNVMAPTGFYQRLAFTDLPK
jgi:hypothetical protein